MKKLSLLHPLLLAGIPVLVTANAYIPYTYVEQILYSSLIILASVAIVFGALLCVTKHQGIAALSATVVAFLCLTYGSLYNWLLDNFDTLSAMAIGWRTTHGSPGAFRNSEVRPVQGDAESHQSDCRRCSHSSRTVSEETPASMRLTLRRTPDESTETDMIRFPRERAAFSRRLRNSC